MILWLTMRTGITIPRRARLLRPASGYDATAGKIQTPKQARFTTIAHG